MPRLGSGARGLVLDDGNSFYFLFNVCFSFSFFLFFGFGVMIGLIE
jgi:hypothetical protein